MNNTGCALAVFFGATFIMCWAIYYESIIVWILFFGIVALVVYEVFTGIVTAQGNPKIMHANESLKADCSKQISEFYRHCNSGGSHDELREIFREDFREIFGERWKDVTISELFKKSGDDASSEYWLYHLMLAKQGKVDGTRMGVGYKIVSPENYNMRLSRQLDIRFVARLEKLLNSNQKFTRISFVVSENLIVAKPFYDASKLNYINVCDAVEQEEVSNNDVEAVANKQKLEKMCLLQYASNEELDLYYNINYEDLISDFEFIYGEEWELHKHRFVEVLRMRGNMFSYNVPLWVENVISAKYLGRLSSFHLTFCGSANDMEPIDIYIIVRIAQLIERYLHGHKHKELHFVFKPADDSGKSSVSRTIYVEPYYKLLNTKRLDCDSLFDISTKESNSNRRDNIHGIIALTLLIAFVLFSIACSI